MPYNIKRLDLNALPFCSTREGALPDFPVLYIIFDDETVYYVGATVSLFNRWSGHRSDWKVRSVIKRRGVKVAWIVADVKQFSDFELALIRFLKPKLNRMETGYHHANIKRPKRNDYQRLKKSSNNHLG